MTHKQTVDELIEGIENPYFDVVITTFQGEAIKAMRDENERLKALNKQMCEAIDMPELHNTMTEVECITSMAKKNVRYEKALRFITDCYLTDYDAGYEPTDAEIESHMRKTLNQTEEK